MARSFDGSTGYGLSATVPIAGAPFTVAMWILLGSHHASADTTYFTLSAAGNSTDFFKVYSVNAATRVRALSSNGGGSAYAESSSNLGFVGNWRFIAGVFAADDDRRAFIGSLKGTNATSIAIGTCDQMSAGAQFVEDLASEYMNGRIQELGVWNIALADGEIAQLANGAMPPLIRPESLLSYIPLLGYTSPEPDFVGGHAMTINGTATSAEGPPNSLMRPRRMQRAWQGTASVLADAVIRRRR